VGDAAADSASERRKHVISAADLSGSLRAAVTAEAPRRRATDVVEVERSWLSARRVGVTITIAVVVSIAVAGSFWHPSGVIVGALAASVVWLPACATMRIVAARQRYERERLLRRLVAVSDLERRRIAAEVHDGVLQDMIGISFSMETVAKTAPPESCTMAHHAANGMRGAITDLRSLLMTMYPVQVPTEGWLHGLDDLIDDLRRGGVRVDLEVGRSRLSAMNEVLALRVTRESLRNVAAHSLAQHVRISAHRVNGYARVTIVDDGIGFDSDTAERRSNDGHFGLRLSQDLAREMGASLTVRSEPGVGTEVELVMKESQ
jgi:two-component system, NarL family, sensor kinase